MQRPSSFVQPPASPAFGVTKASAPKPVIYSRQYTAGSPRVSIRRCCKTPRRCSMSWRDISLTWPCYQTHDGSSRVSPSLVARARPSRRALRYAGMAALGHYVKLYIAASSARAASRSSRAWSSPSSSASSASLFDQSRENRPFDFGGPTPAPAGRRRAFRPKLI